MIHGLHFSISRFLFPNGVGNSQKHVMVMAKGSYNNMSSDNGSGYINPSFLPEEMLMERWCPFKNSMEQKGTPIPEGSLDQTFPTL